MTRIVPGNGGGVVVEADHFHRLPVMFAQVRAQHVLGSPVAVAAPQEGVPLEAPGLPAADHGLVARHILGLLDVTPDTNNSQTVTTRSAPHSTRVTWPLTARVITHVSRSEESSSPIFSRAASV